MLLNHRLAQIQSVIDGYQSEIEQLQRKIQEMQAHAQRVGSVESAMESAVTQLQTAIALINQVCPDELVGFQQVINDCFGGAPIAELAGAEPESPAPTPTEPQVVDAIAEPIEDGKDDVAPAEANGEGVATNVSNSNGNDHRPLAYDELVLIDRRTLAKVCDRKGIEIAGKRTTKALAQALSEAEVTEADFSK